MIHQHTSFRCWEFTQDLRDFQKVYLTVVPTKSFTSIEEVEEIFHQVGNCLTVHQMIPLQEKIYGSSRFFDEMNQMRVRHYKSHEKLCKMDGFPASYPVSYIQGNPCAGGLFGGLQMIAVKVDGHEVSMSPVTWNREVIGRKIETPFFKEMFLSQLSADGLDQINEPASHPTKSPSYQAMNLFRKLFAILKAEDYEPQELLRTWIYLPKILNWYGSFNEARTNVFKEIGLFDRITGKPAHLPASTGIQGFRKDGEHCFLDAFSYKSKSKNSKREIWKTILSERQKEAFEYGSTFSRGISVQDDKSKTLYISGTASIDPAGKTIYLNDDQGQIIETLLNVAALLKTENAGLKNLVQATVFCKTEETYRRFIRMSDLLDLNDLPFLPVFADVCRDDLFVEIEAIAIA